MKRHTPAPRHHRRPPTTTRLRRGQEESQRGRGNGNATAAQALVCPTHGHATRVGAVDPTCPMCFPDYDAASSSSSGLGAAVALEEPMSFDAELAVILLDASQLPGNKDGLDEDDDGIKGGKVITAIRCNKNDSLSVLRQRLELERFSHHHHYSRGGGGGGGTLDDLLPQEYSFVRMVGGKAVELSSAQEEDELGGAGRGYAVKHFCPPRAPLARMYIRARGPSASSLDAAEVGEGNATKAGGRIIEPQEMPPLPPGALSSSAPATSATATKNRGGRGGQQSSLPPRRHREKTEGMIEFCVRRLDYEEDRKKPSSRNGGVGASEGDDGEGDNAPGRILGMIRLHRDETLASVRSKLEMEQLVVGADSAGDRESIASHISDLPAEYRFVRMLEGNVVTVLTNAQEEGTSPRPLRAYHFAPPYTPRPELILLSRRTYVVGQTVPDETKHRELKSIQSPLTQRSWNPRDAVKDKVTSYINAFLNSSGGTLIFGVSDDGIVERVPIAGLKDDVEMPMKERVQLARSAKDDIRKLVDAVCKNMDPPVDDDLVSTSFVPVRPARQQQKTTKSSEATGGQQQDNSNEEDELYCIIEISVKPSRQPLHFLNDRVYDAYERRDGSTQKMDVDAAMDALMNRDRAYRIDNDGGSGGGDGSGSGGGAADNDDDDDAIGWDGRRAWRGGWRQLRSSYDFQPLMRRLSDPWAGREWLFAAIRRFLYAEAVAEWSFLSSSPSGSAVRGRGGGGGGGRASCCGIGIVGSRGTGKTSFLSELALRPRRVTGLDVVAHHLCRSDDVDTLNPALFVHSIAAMLTTNCREYRSLMLAESSSSGRRSGGSGRGRVGADDDDESSVLGETMLRALRPSHCESDPDDAFYRGVLRPLWAIEERNRERIRRDGHSHGHSGDDDGRGKGRKVHPPLVILVDALDESLASATERRPGRSGSTTVAHLLERAASSGIGFPPGVKLIVSFRSEMADVPGPVQRLARRLHVVVLDPDPSSAVQMRRASADIRMFLEAYIERARMLYPLGRRRGDGVWSLVKAMAYVEQAASVRGRVRFERLTDDGGWIGFDESINYDLLLAHEEGAGECFYMIGKQMYAADLTMMEHRCVTSGATQNIRVVQELPAAPVDVPSSMPSSDVDVNVAVESRLPDELHGCTLVAGRDDNDGSEGRGIESVESEETLLIREEQLLDALARLSEGNYLYARSVLEDINSERLRWEEVPSLPKGLDHLYARFFQRYGAVNDGGVIPTGSSALGDTASFRAVQPVLEILLAAPKRGITEKEIRHAVVAGGACDQTAVPFCLRDIRWALDIDDTGVLPRYHLRHESIRSWLTHGGDTHSFRCREENGHKLLAASLLQRCWPQQLALSRWLQGMPSRPECSRLNRTGVSLSTDQVQEEGWVGYKPNGEDVYDIVTHLVLSTPHGLSLNSKTEDNELVSLLRSVGKSLLDDIYGRNRKTTALHSAALAGNFRAVKLLLNAGASPNVVASGRSPLHLAASKGFAETVRVLLSSGADIFCKTTSGRTALLCAAARGSTTTVECILEAIAQAEANAGDDAGQVAEVRALLDSCQSDTGRTPLSLAAEEGHDGVIQALLSAGSNATLADLHGRTPIYHAARHGRVHPDTIKALANSPGGPDSLHWGERGHLRSPLHAAVWHGHVSIVKALLECNADPNLVENDCGTPLHEAAYFGSYGLAASQKNHKSDGGMKLSRPKMTSPSVSGETLPTFSTANTSTTSPPENKRVVSGLCSAQDSLIMSGEDVELEHPSRSAPICEEESRLEILSLLLSSGRCNIDQGEMHGCTPLWYAAGGGWTKAVEALLDAGACIDPGDLPRVKDRRGPASPLLLAVKRGHYETARLLVLRGARVPADCDTEELCKLLHLSNDLRVKLEALKASPTKNALAPNVVGYAIARKCLPVPSEAFAPSIA